MRQDRSTHDDHLVKLVQYVRYEAMNCLIFNLIPRISLLPRGKQVVKLVSSLFGQVVSKIQGW